MPGGAILSTSIAVDRVEAPITFKAYLMCAFAAFGGIFFGYDSGYISGVMGMQYFVALLTGLDPDTTPIAQFTLPSWKKSAITSILSAGTFFGALMAGDFADYVGRRPTIIFGCIVLMVGVALQTASAGFGLLLAGRLVAGFGVGYVSAIIILYMSEIAPRKVRGAIVSGYQFCITVGLLIASCVDYGTQNRIDSGSYRIPIALQMFWALVLGIGLFFLPESPRYFVKKDKLDKAVVVLAKLRGQPCDSDYVQQELAEIVANNDYESRLIPQNNYFESWFACFRGNLRDRSSNLRRTILGTSIQMMQQWTGINFIFYFGTTFFQELGTISDPFLMSLITSLVNVCSTPISFWTIEKFGRRPLMIWGALGMLLCEFVIAIVGVIYKDNPSAFKAMISFICIYIFFFASTWGPGAWVVTGEIFPLPIRSRGVALSVASNWLWNCVIAVITPYMVGTDQGNLGPRVFFIWGSLCTVCLVYAYFLIPETKGLTLEQVDRMLEECATRASSKWVPHSTLTTDFDLTEKSAVLETIEHKEEKIHV
ncbi:general substrate transporter [Lipomyces doorenjongii]